MAPPDLCNQWLHFWQAVVRKIELPHVKNISAMLCSYPQLLEVPGNPGGQLGGLGV
jgi:hypothetical protein